MDGNEAVSRLTESWRRLIQLVLLEYSDKLSVQFCNFGSVLFIDSLSGVWGDCVR